MINETDRIDYDSLSHEHPTVFGDVVFLPVTQCGKFIGWTALKKKYFTDEQLKAIQEEMERLGAQHGEETPES